MSQKIRAIDAWQKMPPAHCSNCGDGAGDAPENQIWFFWNGRLYCPECASDHGVDE